MEEARPAMPGARRVVFHVGAADGPAVEFDVFFSISQTPVAGVMPDEATMFRNWLEQVAAADRLGFGVAWLAESHLSSEVQKRNRHPVIPHWQGEVGLNCDMLQSAHAIFARTGPARRDGHVARSNGGRGIEVGSAVMNILQGGGPIAHAERIAYFAALEGLKDAPRRIHVGFSAGRFDYMNRAHGHEPRDLLEAAVPYPLLKGKWFHEATEIFCRLLAGQTLGSNDVADRTVTRADCRSDEDWQRIHDVARRMGRIEMRPATHPLGATAAGAAGTAMIPAASAVQVGDSARIPSGADGAAAPPAKPETAGGPSSPRGPASRSSDDAILNHDVEHVLLPKRFVFEELKVVPQDWDRGLVQLVAGSHDPSIPALANRYLPTQVANLSITPPEVIERTHVLMRDMYHRAGGPWQRRMMPRTVMVFLNEEPGLSPAERRQAAVKEAKAALGAYWAALEGTLDPRKVENAADNAVIGDAQDVARQLTERFHPDDRLMLWFDFFNHDSARVVRDMGAFMHKVAPALASIAS